MITAGIDIVSLKNRMLSDVVRMTAYPFTLNSSDFFFKLEKIISKLTSKKYC